MNTGDSLEFGMIHRRGAIALAIGVLGCVSIAVALWLSLKPLMIAYQVRHLRQLRSQGGGNSALGTDECMFFLFTAGAVKLGMSYDVVVDVLGNPNEKHGMKNGLLRCEWHGRDLGGNVDGYVVTFDQAGKAAFVPWVRRKYRQGGTIVVDLVRIPEDGRAISVPP